MTTGMTTMAEMTESPKGARGEVRRASLLEAVQGGPRRVSASLRTRILAWFIGLLALATLGSVLVTRTVLLVRLDQRIDAELTQESAELRRLANGNDPETGEPFRSDVRRIFEVFFERNVPARNEALITFVAGRPFLRSRQVVPYRLDRDAELVARWGAVREPDRARVDTPAGQVEYLAVPLRVRGEAAGVFVAAIFRDRVKADVDDAVRAAGAVGLAVLLLGSVLAWRLADTVVRPVSALTRTARSISETDLSGRIPVRGRDEVAQLAATFNEMLGRLERAFASQRRFVDDAGHELKTPLTIVRGHLELLEDDPDERRETLALVMDELDRMSRIVQDLLLLAKHEQPDFLDLATVEVGGLTDDVQAKVKALASRDWVLEGHGRGVIVADPQRLTQALLQLAQNAARYSSEAEPIGLGSAVADGEARFWVRDHGPGIPLAEHDKVFERFSRGSGGRRSEGAGLGLAIVKAIAEAHRGRVELESGPEAGSVFTIVIPIDQPDRREEEAP
jgi:two-component system OmpR family sensor kinase